MSDGRAAWFVDGSYLYNVWRNLHRADRLDYLLLRRHLEDEFRVGITDAYYFNSVPELQTESSQAFHEALAYPPPTGPGLRVKLYWLQEREMYWPSSWGGGPIVHPDTGRQFKLTQQKAVDVGLAFHLMRSHENQQWHTLLLATGDADFHEVVQHLVEYRDVAVILIGSMDSISRKLLPYAQAVVELDRITEAVARQMH